MKPEKPPSCRLLGLSPAADDRLAWGVIALASGRMSYLQHGLLAPGWSPDDILRGYSPNAVAILAEDPAEADRLAAAARAVLGVSARGPAQAPAVLTCSRTHLNGALGPDPEAAVVALLALPQNPRPPRARSALAAAAALAMGGLPGPGSPGAPKTAAVVPLHAGRLGHPRAPSRGRRNPLPL